jgi:hypothetical protein
VFVVMMRGEGSEDRSRPSVKNFEGMADIFQAVGVFSSGNCAQK